MVLQILRSLGSMIWEVYWPLTLGFMLSAVVRALIPARRISSGLGKPNASGLGRAVLFGALSSSCSYAAASMMRTLVAKGAAWSNAVAFMIASTNLVFEIFLVIVTLLGWAFFGGEVVGGLVYILLGFVAMRFFVHKEAQDQARGHLHAGEHAGDLGAHAHQAGQPPVMRGIKRTAAYFTMDVSMVGKDIALGIVVASVLAVVVPQAFWTSLFATGSGHASFGVVCWNAVVGLVVAVLAFVCSVGNILLASVLWQGGINFAGVIAFILADLVTIPMLLIYRRYYGAAMMFRLFGILAAGIFLSAVGTEYLFRAADWVPSARQAQGTMEHGFGWNYQTILNLISIPLSVALFWIGKRRRHAGRGGHSGQDPAGQAI